MNEDTHPENTFKVLFAKHYLTAPSQPLILNSESAQARALELWFGSGARLLSARKRALARASALRA